MVEQNSIPSVVLVDDDLVITECLGSCLQQRELAIVLGTATHAQAGVMLALEQRPDVVILDIHMPGADAFWACREILRRSQQQIRVLFFTGFPLDQYLDRCLESGGSGVMSKHSESVDSIGLALRHVVRGGQYFSPELASRFVEIDSGEQISRFASLAERELEVLRQLSVGFTNREIANQLKISLRSVEKEVADLKQKLRFNTTNELLMFAAREGLVFPELLGYRAGADEPQPETLTAERNGDGHHLEDCNGIADEH